MDLLALKLPHHKASYFCISFIFSGDLILAPSSRLFASLLKLYPLSNTETMGLDLFSSLPILLSVTFVRAFFLECFKFFMVFHFAFFSKILVYSLNSPLPLCIV